MYGNAKTRPETPFSPFQNKILLIYFRNGALLKQYIVVGYSFWKLSSCILIFREHCTLPTSKFLSLFIVSFSFPWVLVNCSCLFHANIVFSTNLYIYIYMTYNANDITPATFCPNENGLIQFWISFIT